MVLSLFSHAHNGCGYQPYVKLPTGKLQPKQISKTLIIGLLLLLMGLFSQAQKVTLSEKNVSLQKIFRQIHRQTGYQFFYEDALLDQAGKISVSVQDVSLEQALNACFKNLPIAYEISNKTILVHQKVPVKIPAPVTTGSESGTTVKGLVRSLEGELLEGVTVMIKGSDKGTVTTKNGVFSLDGVDEKTVLILSSVNLKKQEVTVGGRLSLVVTMEAQISPLDEVQIIGYGNTTRRLKTGSVSTLKSEDLERQPVTNLTQAMQGRMAGVAINQSNGAIGSGGSIQIRGVNTLAQPINSSVAIAGFQPLIILDGAILPDPNVSNFVGNSNSAQGYLNTSSGLTTMDLINPNDIESIEVLKDADATSIYGSRGTNGVILITSKKAKMGATKFNLDVSTWTSAASYLPPRLSLDQYLQMRKDAFAMGVYNPTTGVAITPVTPTALTAPDLLTWDQTTATKDWTDYEYGNKAPTINVQGNLSGGDKRLNFYASGGYFKQNDITLGSPTLRRVSGDVSVNHTSANDRLKVSFKTAYLVNDFQPSRGGNLSGGGLSALPPNMPMYNADGTSYWPSPTLTLYTQLTNPVLTEVIKQKNTTNRLTTNFDIGYKIAKGLTAKMALGYTYQTGESIRTTPSTSINPLIVPASTTNVPNNNTIFSTFKTLNFEPQINYNTNIGKGKLDALIGGTIFDRLNEASSINVQGYTSDVLLGSWAAGSTVASKFNSSLNYKFNSIFGRLGYNWSSKYLANFTFRRDGSSRFGPKKQFGNFGSVGLGWVFSKEDFLSNKIPGLSYGKLRASYGSTGNDNIGDYLYTSIYTTANGTTYYNGATGLTPSSLIDSSISWETARKMDLALELGFIQDRILVNVNWYRTKTTNMLVSGPVAVQTGFASFTTNYPAVLENKGWEFEIISKNLAPQSKFQWNTNFNLSTLKNTLLAFPNLASSAYAKQLQIGYPVNNPSMPLNTEWALIYEGVDPATGLAKFTDTDKSGSIVAASDRQYIGSTIPTLFGGLGNNYSFKGFQLDVFFQFSKQLVTNWMYGNTATTYPGQLSNPVAEFYNNYWKQVGDVSKYPRLYYGVGGNAATTVTTTNFGTSSATLVNLFYARLKNISLSYSLPTAFISKAKISKMVVYVRGQNLGTWMSDKIYKDPEALQLRQSSPIVRTFSFGTQISF